MAVIMLKLNGISNENKALTQQNTSSIVVALKQYIFSYLHHFYQAYEWHS